MIVIIAGTRGFQDYEYLAMVIREGCTGWPITQVVSGAEPTGVDALGERWAWEHGISVAPFPADWARFKNAAGPMRNTAMADYAATWQGRLLALWDGESRGTRDMIDKARSRKIPTFIWYL